MKIKISSRLGSGVGIGKMAPYEPRRKFHNFRYGVGGEPAPPLVIRSLLEGRFFCAFMVKKRGSLLTKPTKVKQPRHIVRCCIIASKNFLAESSQEKRS